MPLPVPVTSGPVALPGQNGSQPFSRRGHRGRRSGQWVAQAEQRARPAARPRAAVPSVPSSTGGNSAARSERATNAARRGTTTTAHAALLYCRRPYQQHIPAPKCYAYREFLRSRVPSSRRSPAARTIIVGSTGPPSISRIPIHRPVPQGEHISSFLLF